MKIESTGRLINKSGKRNYTNSDAPEKLIRYITRTNRNPREDLITWGGIGVTEFGGMKAVIEQFYMIQEAYQRKGDFGRYMDHEIFSLSAGAEKDILENNADIDGIARKMARDIYERDHCQVVYGVHKSDGNDSRMHIHFGINTVDFQTKRKWRENKRQTKERGERFQQIVAKEIRRYVKKCRESEF